MEIALQFERKKITSNSVSTKFVELSAHNIIKLYAPRKKTVTTLNPSLSQHSTYCARGRGDFLSQTGAMCYLFLFVFVPSLLLLPLCQDLYHCLDTECV
jgi:hypothetical protein